MGMQFELQQSGIQNNFAGKLVKSWSRVKLESLAYS